MHFTHLIEYDPPASSEVSAVAGILVPPAKLSQCPAQTQATDTTPFDENSL